MSHVHGRTAFAWAACLITALACVTPTHADQIGVDGDTLRGTIKQITASTIELDTEYGKGTVSVPIEDVESVSSETEFYFVHGNSGSTRGQLAGIRDGKFLVGSSEESAVSIDAASVHEVYDAAVLDGSMGWLRRATLLWHGAFDLGYSLTRSTVDTTAVAVGFVADRKKAPSRVTANASYRYGTQKEEDDTTGDKEESTTENEIKGRLRGEYDVIPHMFVFASQDAEYDEIESLSIRAVPQTGVGYRFWESKTGLFQLEVGGAYVYEKFFGGDDDGYFGISFGKLLEWKLPIYDSEFHWRTDYLPSVDDFTGDYLVRSEAALLVPMISWLKFKIGLGDTYDSTPADDTDKNTFTSTAGIAATY